ncbi:NAD(P)-dependent oxidoreductase [Pseudaestuariivita atlantica]|uniref:6-phosphogluconate dehydrogenase n=1 Tax=Pseudaestuariivita atlantica TaxID=1317121 RepID=A0A0L1JW42_9RHOB|nr:NAD(P)-dependent oxidoreductase [Pseudaestuariivita atlantica]KNG95623.1 6-phosphogluconate dehydrogenase [Pseudaestuariivita atlantica]
MSKPSIGFIGLGLMGSAMVTRLQSLGYPMTVVANRSRAAIDAAVERGATEVKTAREVAEASDITMLCVDTTANVEARMRGPDGVIAGLGRGKVVIDFGTSLPGSTRALGEEVAATGAQMLDSPIGRTPSHAIEGKINLMCSGDKATYDRVKPVLDDLGENVFHLGALGSGHTIKLINNFFAQCIANGMAEAFAMADVAGVDRKMVYDVIAAGPLHNGMMDFIAAYGLDGDDQKLAFSIKNAAKDVGYYAQMCEDAGFASMMSEAPLSALKAAIDQGRGEDMVPRMVDFFGTRAKG